MQENIKITGATSSEGRLYFKLKQNTSVAWYEITNFRFKDNDNYILFSTPYRSRRVKAKNYVPRETIEDLHNKARQIKRGNTLDLYTLRDIARRENVTVKYLEQINDQGIASTYGYYLVGKHLRNKFYTTRKIKVIND
jgi:hypothetical protein